MCLWDIGVKKRLHLSHKTYWYEKNNFVEKHREALTDILSKVGFDTASSRVISECTVGDPFQEIRQYLAAKNNKSISTV